MQFKMWIRVPGFVLLVGGLLYMMVRVQMAHKPELDLLVGVWTMIALTTAVAVLVVRQLNKLHPKKTIESKARPSVN